MHLFVKCTFPIKGYLENGLINGVDLQTGTV